MKITELITLHFRKLFVNMAIRCIEANKCHHKGQRFNLSFNVHCQSTVTKLPGKKDCLIQQHFNTSCDFLLSALLLEILYCWNTFQS